MKRVVSLLAMIVACDDGPVVRQAETKVALEAALPCARAPEPGHAACLDFGLVRAGASSTAELHVAAANTSPVTILALRIEGPDAAVFSASSTAPLTVPGSSRARLPISFSPTYAPGAAHAWAAPREDFLARVVLTTDDPERPELSALVVGAGGIARGRAEPSRVDFGDVRLGGTSLRRVAIVNEGVVPLVEEAHAKLARAAADAGFSFASSPAFGEVAPGARVAFDLAFEPPAIGAATTSLELVTSDPAGPLVVSLSGRGLANAPPIACLGIARVYGRFLLEKERVGGSYELEPSDRIVLTARAASDGAADATCASDSADPEGDPVTLAWGPATGPAGVGATLTTSGAIAPLEPWQRELVVDAPGTYTVPLAVTENNGVGLRGETAAALEVARRGIAVELEWSASDGSTRDVDLDLHLVRPAWPGESFASPRVCTGTGGPDCYWSSCRLTTAGEPPLDWGPSGADDAGGTADAIAHDPLLERDSTGATPLVEQASIARPFAGDYEVWVHFFEDARAGRPGRVPFTLRVTYGDAAPETIAGTLAAQGWLQQVATLRWTGAPAGSTIEPSTAAPQALARCAP